jgi:hypothetical protein
MEKGSGNQTWKLIRDNRKGNGASHIHALYRIDNESKNSLYAAHGC